MISHSPAATEHPTFTTLVYLGIEYFLLVDFDNILPFSSQCSPHCTFCSRVQSVVITMSSQSLLDLGGNEDLLPFEVQSEFSPGAGSFG